MTRKQIAITAALVIIAAAAGWSMNAGIAESRAYTLYRDSPIGKDLRLHIATFNAAESEDYNRENCRIASELFKAQPGVTARYWCEKGAFQK